MAAENDTPLGLLIDRQIAEAGPMSFASYMQLCLTHPVHGYYHRPDPIGRGGDFITAPEISQIFGESLGLFVALLSRQFAGGAFDIVELGPGRGTLMADLRRSLARTAPEAKPGNPLLVEISESLKATQAHTLAAFSPDWLPDIASLPETGPPLVIIANEFFDALPVRQYQKTETGWHERMIGLEDDKRVWGLNPAPLPAGALPDSLGDAPLNARFETRAGADALMVLIGDRLSRRGGCLIALDYGYEKTQTGDTIQAIAGHAFADPLARPGEADLTAHVDFAALSAADERLTAHPLLTQGTFLMALGAGERARILSEANPGHATSISTDLARLTAPEQMGEIFKAICISSSGLSPYPFALGN